MRSRTIVATLSVLLCGAGTASAQALALQFNDGRVRLKADNVPASRILAEWARVGGTRIVHGERVPGPPLTLDIVDAPERQALDIVLRDAAGYMVLARDTTAAGASTFDRILVLPTTTRAPAAAPTPPPGQSPVFPAGGNNLDDADDDSQAPFVPPPPGAFPRGRAPNVNRPPPGALPPQNGAQPFQVAPQPVPQDDDDDDVDEDVPENGPPPPSPGNPFGVVPGGSRPGTITPVPQQQPRDPNPQQPPQQQPR
jgi:hypothetical protein